jgi:hypothetical protein
VSESVKRNLAKEAIEESNRLLIKYNSGSNIPYQVAKNDIAATLLIGIMAEMRNPTSASPENKKEEKKKMVEKMTLFEVMMVYGENRTAPIIETKKVVAPDIEGAKARAGFIPQPEWDLDYYNLVVKPIIDVNVKEKPTEIKSV